MKTRTQKQKTGRKKPKMRRYSTKKRITKTKKQSRMNNEKLNKINCSPKSKNEINEFSCYTNDSLYKLRNLWNERHPDATIQTNDTKEIHEQLASYLKNVCNKESCWLKQTHDFGNINKSTEFTDSFAPESPGEWDKNPNEWLTSVDILNVMKQYEKAYKCFDFIGPSPIDFDERKLYGECVWEELCNFSLAEQIKHGKTKIGMIFNTDPHDKPGQHWISMFIDIKKRQISFFDSVGSKIPPKIMKLVERIQEQGRKMTPKLNIKFDQNYPVEHQYGSTECGVYSIFFIVHMLEDKITEHYLKTHILKDNDMSKFRKIYFNDSL
jgi:hypothetical protein